MELLQTIEDSFMASASIVGDRIMVECVGIRTASELKAFMLKNGFNYVYGAYEDGVYTLGFNGDIMKEILKKPYGVLVELFETAENDIARIESLRSVFCSEMANVIVSLKNNESIMINGLNDVFLADVENGDYSRAFQVFKYLEDAKI